MVHEIFRGPKEIALIAQGIKYIFVYVLWSLLFMTCEYKFAK